MMMDRTGVASWPANFVVGCARTGMCNFTGDFNGPFFKKACFTMFHPRGRYEQIRRLRAANQRAARPNFIDRRRSPRRNANVEQGEGMIQPMRSLGVVEKGGQAPRAATFRSAKSDAAGSQSPFFNRPLRDQLLHHLAVHVGQAEVAAGVAVGELLVVEAQQVQDRGVQVVDVDLVLHGLEAELVGGAVDVAALARRRRPATS